MDVVFINPSVGSNYQSLKNEYTSIEPPTWSLLLAESMRNFGFDVSIIDVNAENLSDKSAYERIKKLNPRLVCFVVYGQNVNAGTTNMEEATKLSQYIKLQNDNILISFIGSHVQALPKETLINENSIDIIFTNEGVYSLKSLLKLKKIEEKYLENIRGICFRKNGAITITAPERVVPNERMDLDLPGYAWDLLPYKKNHLICIDLLCGMLNMIVPKDLHMLLYKLH